MDTLVKYATIDDLLSAAELILGQEKCNIGDSDLDGLINTLSVLNIACIQEADHVVTIGSNLDIATWMISYIFTPELIVSYDMNTSDMNTTDIDTTNSRGFDHVFRDKCSQLLAGYRYTEPIFLDLGVKLMKEALTEECFWEGHFKEGEQSAFEVAIVSCVNQIRIMDLETISSNRFLLDLGIEFDIFEKLLIKSCKLLMNNGRLMILAKPSWILKIWNLIHDLGLQLEYKNYSFYTNQIRHPNTLVWLRFVKKEDEFDVELHKQNIVALLEDNNIDRLYAHRNRLIYPYVELSYTNSDSYIKLDQNKEYMQYFFSYDTTEKLAQLCEGYTACLVTPSIAQCAFKSNKNVVLFERDNRFRENGGLKYVKYDLYAGLTKYLFNRYAHKFDRVICDPPFDVKLDVLADDIAQLMKPSDKSAVYIVFPANRSVSLFHMMKSRGFISVEEPDKIVIEYAKPPKLVRMNGKDAIQLYKFTAEP